MEDKKKQEKEKAIEMMIKKSTEKPKEKKFEKEMSNDDMVLEKITDMLIGKGTEYFVKSNIDSYNVMLDNIQEIIRSDISIQLDDTDVEGPSMLFVAKEIRFVPQKLEDKLITAPVCLQYKMNYYTSIEVKYDQTLIKNSQTKTTIETDWIEMVKLPIMIGSKICTSKVGREVRDPLFSREDAGGYFILKGNKKAIFYKPRLKFNEVLVVPVGKGAANETDNVLSINELAVNIVSKRAYSYPNYQHFLIIKCDQSVFKLSISTLAPDQHYNVFSVIKAMTDKRDMDIIEYFIKDEYLSRSSEEVMSLLTVTLQESIKNPIDQKTVEVIKYSIAHLDEESDKSEFLLYCIKKLLRVSLKYEPIDVRDSYSRTKLMDSPGSLIEELFISYMKITRKMMKDKIRNQSVLQNTSTLLSELKAFQTEYMLKFFISNDYWGTSKRKNVCELIQPTNYLSQLEHLRKITEEEKEKNVIMEKRRSHTDYQGFICSITTPTSQNVGLHKHWALFAFTNPYIYKYHHVWLKELREYMRNEKKTEDSVYDIFVDGIPIGRLNIERVKEMERYINEKKFSDLKKYGEYTVQYTDYTRLTLNLNTHGGRIMVPVIKLKNNRVPIEYNEIRKIESIEEFQKKYPGVFDYIDTHWIDHNPMGISIEEIDKYNEGLKIYNETAHYEYFAVHLNPYAQYSISIALNAFASYQAPTRNLHLAKQLVSSITCNPGMEYMSLDKTKKHLIRGSVPMTESPIAKYMGVDEMPVVVEMFLEMSSEISTQEDSYKMNWNAIARGLLAIYEYKTYEMYVSFKSDEKFYTPTTKNRYLGYNFSKLGPDGIIKMNEEVVYGDVLMCKIDNTGDDSVYVMPKVEYYDQYSPGRVTSIDRYKNNIDAREYVIVKICKTSMGDAADKLSTDQGQKGVIGEIASSSEFGHSDLGFISSIKCSASAHTRMTGGQLMTTLTNYYGLINGHRVINNTFKAIDINGMRDYMEDHGFHRDFLCRMYREECSLVMLNSVCVVPISFRRMRQLADIGSVKKADSGNDPITKNPLKGKNGGIKIGRMEKDAFEVHGVSDYMQSITNYNEKYTICNKCGIRADEAQCVQCKSSSNIVKAKIPAALGAVIEMCKPLGIKIKTHIDPKTMVI